MSSVEIIILSVTGIIAMLTYIVKHFKKSECWSKKACFSCKMDKDDKSKSELSIESEEIKKIEEYVNEQDLKVTVSSVV